MADSGASVPSTDPHRRRLSWQTPQLTNNLAHPTDSNTYIVTPMNHCRARTGKLYCLPDLLSACPALHHPTTVRTTHLRAFSGHGLEVIVHRRFRKCFFHKNMGWGFLDLTTSFLSARSKFIRIYLPPPTGHLDHMCTVTNVSKAATDTHRFPCDRSQHWGVWDHWAEQVWCGRNCPSIRPCHVCTSLHLPPPQGTTSQPALLS